MGNSFLVENSSSSTSGLWKSAWSWHSGSSSVRCNELGQGAPTCNCPAKASSGCPAFEAPACQSSHSVSLTTELQSIGCNLQARIVTRVPGQILIVNSNSCAAIVTLCVKLVDQKSLGLPQSETPTEVPVIAYPGENLYGQAGLNLCEVTSLNVKLSSCQCSCNPVPYLNVYSSSGPETQTTTIGCGVISRVTQKSSTVTIELLNSSLCVRRVSGTIILNSGAKESGSFQDLAPRTRYTQTISLASGLVLVSLDVTSVTSPPTNYGLYQPAQPVALYPVLPISQVSSAVDWEEILESDSDSSSSSSSSSDSESEATQRQPQVLSESQVKSQLRSKTQAKRKAERQKRQESKRSAQKLQKTVSAELAAHKSLQVSASASGVHGKSVQAEIAASAEANVEASASIGHDSSQ